MFYQYPYRRHTQQHADGVYKKRVNRKTNAIGKTEVQSNAIGRRNETETGIRRRYIIIEGNLAASDHEIQQLSK